MGQTKENQPPQGLGVLLAESWGWRMKRAREDHARLTMDQAVAEIGRHFLTSKASISRMEDSREIPADPRRRALACVAAIVYGLDPTQFGVGSGDLPPGVVSDINGTRLEDLPPTRWLHGRVVDIETRKSQALPAAA